MTNFAIILENEVKSWHLLQHPFYQAWNDGTLEVSMIKDYAKQYYHHVKAFPRYISATHSICDSIADRKILLENLNDEENNGTDHPTLWMEFATAVGNEVEEVKNNIPDESINNVVDTFFKYSRSSYAEGLAALYTYEHQIPEIALTKMKGLKQFYAPNNKQALKFFEVHAEADIWHREQCKILLNRLSDDERVMALEAAVDSAKALWNFLSAMAQKHGIAC